MTEKTKVGPAWGAAGATILIGGMIALTDPSIAGGGSSAMVLGGVMVLYGFSMIAAYCVANWVIRAP